MGEAWLEEFVAGVEKLFGIRREEAKGFAEAMARGDEELVKSWLEKNGLSDEDFLVLSAMYVLYKAEEKVSEILEGLELRVDEAIALVGSLMAQLINGVGGEDKRAVLAQILLASALQIEDKELRDKIAGFARSLLG
ncbi:MAG: hypothetical protein TU35_008035 [Thermoproteus sp. AZ2]|jgi:hypothetical protein|uniref:Uncharacterized protein n=1 Tax=Thermoproteus sp. AZ2 TaxID=1609232 RepID=A0ACC6V2D6_9CREN|nr:MAG: hypothetical protein TU35_00485 [Thermoproteus sp. AZ2]